MASNVENVADDIEKGVIKKISKEDSFDFSCDACGKCCRNRNDIIVSPYDVFKVAKHLNMSCEDFVRKHTTFNIGPHSGWPILTLIFKDKSLKGDGSDTVCSFLRHKDGKFLCRIHDAKPFVCIAYPLGRTIEMDKTKNGTAEVQYILQPIDCGTKDEKQSVKEWLRPEHEESDEFFVEYNTLMDDLIKIINLHKVDISKSKDATVAKAMLQVPLIKELYMEYDMEKPFMEQFKEKHELLINMFTEIKKMFQDKGVKYY